MSVQTLIKRNTGMTTLGEVAGQVEKMSENNWDELVKVKEIQLPDIDHMVIGKESYEMRLLAQRGIAYRLAVPTQYIKRCPDYLQGLNLDYWLQQEQNEELFVRFDGNDVRAIFTPRYQPIDNFEIIEKLHTQGYVDKTKVQCYLDKEMMVLNIPESDKTFSINADKMTPGISISNSEVGLASVAIAAYILRLICTNGLIAPAQVSQAKYKHVSRKILDIFPEVLSGAREEATTQQKQLKISMASSVADPVSTMESFNTRFQLNVTERQALEWALAENGVPGTMFHIVQAYTKSANWEGLSAESSYRMQRIGGSILELVN
jgi:hypothetical protein